MWSLGTHRLRETRSGGDGFENIPKSALDANTGMIDRSAVLHCRTVDLLRPDSAYGPPSTDRVAEGMLKGMPTPAFAWDSDD
jgi:hypothetical protein